jgi:carboxypeptidase family protein
MLRRVLRQYLTTTLLIAFTVFAALGQQSRASLRGLVTDERSARIVGASVTLTDSNGQTKATLSNDEGIYVFNGLAPGKYTIRASATTFATSSDVQIELKAGPPQSLDLTLNATIEEQRVTVAADTSLSTDATANANQLVLAGKDLDALPDDPDELGAALRALAGPSLGPDGGQIFIDGPRKSESLRSGE